MVKRSTELPVTLPEMLTPDQAALALNVAKNTVFELIRRAEVGAPDGLKAVKLGKQITRIPASEIEALIARRLGVPRVGEVQP